MSAARSASVADLLDALLPQMQCRRCGHGGCRPYAEAIACGEAINRCPPGGDELIAELAALTARPVTAPDPALGRAQPLALARIDESRCIGCTLCIQACPVDAIVGGAKRMHTVLSALCTGCELCLPPCPVDCIELVPAGRAWSDEDARAARARFDARALRLAAAREGSDAEAGVPAASAARPDPGRDARRQAVAAALLRARRRRAARPDAKAVR
jgi:electron transport complex protein RnfB